MTLLFPEVLVRHEKNWGMNLVGHVLTIDAPTRVISKKFPIRMPLKKKCLHPRKAQRFESVKTQVT